MNVLGRSARRRCSQLPAHPRPSHTPAPSSLDAPPRGLGERRTERARGGASFPTRGRAPPPPPIPRTPRARRPTLADPLTRHPRPPLIPAPRARRGRRRRRRRAPQGERLSADETASAARVPTDVPRYDALKQVAPRPLPTHLLPRANWTTALNQEKVKLVFEVARPASKRRARARSERASSELRPRASARSEQVSAATKK